MATLLDGVTTNTTGTGASHSGPCTVWVSGDLKGGTVVLQGSATDTAGDYAKMDASAMPVSAFKSKGNVTVSAYGTYYLRAILQGAAADADVTVVTTQ